MRVRTASVFVLLALAATAVLAAATTASATPSRNNDCTGCHSGAPSGTVTAVPSTPTPAAGAAYSVVVSIGLTSSGNTGYHVAQTDVSGASTTWMAVSAGGPGYSQTSWTAPLTAPATPGTYYYKVWCVKGPNDSTGQAKAATYSITVPGAPPAPAASLTSITPGHASAASGVVIAGTGLGTSGTVRFGTTVAATTAWSATSITATVPASLAAGATSVSVTPAGGVASNGLAFTVDAPSLAVDTVAPTTSASGAGAGACYRRLVTISLSATDNAGGTGVASITYAVDGGTPVTVPGAGVSVQVGPPDGVHTLSFYATDAAGNAETAHHLRFIVDTSRPATVAPRVIKIKRLQAASLRYEVRDAAFAGNTAQVGIVVKDRRGRVVLRLRLGAQPVNTALTAKFSCRLPRGTYRLLLSATDLAGNTQAGVATQKLVVR